MIQEPGAKENGAYREMKIPEPPSRRGTMTGSLGKREGRSKVQPYRFFNDLMGKSKKVGRNWGGGRWIRGGIWSGGRVRKGSQYSSLAGEFVWGKNSQPFR